MWILTIFHQYFINIHCILWCKYSKCKSVTDMTIDKFKMWKVAALKDFLSKKGLNSSKNCHDCACLLININEASPWTGNMLVVFILNQLCKTAHLQTLYICKQIPISRHKTENFRESGFQMWAIIQSLQISTPSPVLRFDSVVG